MLGGPCRDRTRRDVGRTVQGGDQTRCWADRAGTGPDEMMDGRFRTRPSKIANQTGSTASRREDGTETGRGKQERGPCRGRTRRDVGRPIKGQDQSRCWADGPCRDRPRGDVGRTVQGQGQTSKSVDRAGTGPDEMLDGPCRDRTKRDVGRTVQGQDMASQSADRAGTGPEEMLSRLCRDRTRRDVGRTVQGQD